jgi:4a-hydroxytetrahydrobiopterin dehydratase
MDSTMEMLGPTRLAEAVAHLHGWRIEGNKLCRDFKFETFADAFGFMAIASHMIERLNHHPEWTNVHNRVSVTLTTHATGGITQKDLDLAAVMQGIAQRLIK